MTRIAIIGGTGLDQFSALQNLRTEKVTTPYGETSNVLNIGSLDGHEVIFLPRHGERHNIAPHNINYRANLWALKQQGVTHIVAVNVVGGITENMPPEKIVFPHQIIDYTHSRQHTYSDENADSVISRRPPSYIFRLRAALFTARLRAPDWKPQRKYHAWKETAVTSWV